MSIAQREEQILRIKAASFQSELNEALEQRIQEQVVATVKSILEAALDEELAAALVAWPGAKPRRSGSFGRTTDTQYGRIPDLQVPKLRWGNKQRQWRILQRYQRALTGLLDWLAYVYVMGLSLRDLQEALYFLLGAVLSPTAVNRVTLRVQDHLAALQQAPITQTPPILIVDGVWVDILYPQDEFKLDQAGHRRQCRQAQERAILVALAVWPDGTSHVLHFEVAADEDEAQWRAFFDHLIARGLDPAAVDLIVSDGTHGLPAVMKQRLPQARQQRCVTHKVRGMKRYLTYQQLPEPAETATPLSLAVRKQQWWAELQAEAYAIYDAATYAAAQQLLQDFVTKWQPREPQAVHAFLWGIEHTFTFYQFDASLHPRIRTTNLLERLFREFRAKTDEIGAFPNETSCLTLFFLVVQREHAKHDRPLIMAKNSRH